LISSNNLQESVIDAYGKAVHAMAHSNIPQADQSDMRHGKATKAGTAEHRFDISAGVATTGIKGGDRKKVYSDSPGVGCESAGVWHLIEGREALGHHNQVSFRVRL
jgi:hypothetical protein